MCFFFKFISYHPRGMLSNKKIIIKIDLQLTDITTLRKKIRSNWESSLREVLILIGSKMDEEINTAVFVSRSFYSRK